MREKMKLEAIERMKMLKLSDGCIKGFKKGEVWQSEGIGYLYDIEPEIEKVVSKFEKEYGGLVYHVIYNVTEFGELYSMLYVSKHEEEWEQDRQDILENITFCYVYNQTDEWCSEVGTIGIRSNIGGLIRIS